MKKYYDLKTNEIPMISEIGGKAKSLINLIQGNFKVPFGAVLCVNFFDCWIDQLLKFDILKNHSNNPEKFKEISNALKNETEQLEFSEEQTMIINKIMDEYGRDKLYAVRSSSPEEDLSGASFAGGYETILGVSDDEIFNSVKKAFESCLDERIFWYKHQNGFDTSILRIAVIIQLQISSEISGVGFSLNPINNAFDEAVINSNAGLGESVVSGMITPDEFIIDKTNKEIISKKIGSKEKSIILDIDNIVKEVEGIRDNISLVDEQIIDITNLINKVETYYGFPVDIEWAISNKELFLLQSRPITRYVPLPDSMQTKPNEQPILYLDGSLIKQGINTPISVLGCDCIAKTQSVMFEDMMGKDVTLDVKGGMATTQGGRMYINLSTSIKLQGKKKVVSTWKSVDISSAEMIEKSNLDKYTPKKLHRSMKGVIWGAIKNNRSTIKYVLRARKKPLEYKKWYQKYEDDFDIYLKEIVKVNIPLSEAPVKIFKEYISLLNKMLPMTYAAEFARNKIKKILSVEFDDGIEKMKYLERSLPDNVTIDMGLNLYELSFFPEIRNNDYAAFKKTLENNETSTDFINKWNKYIEIYGCRTTNELDVGTKRPYEDYQEIFSQIKNMTLIEEDFSPLSIYEKSRKLREQSYEDIMNEISGSKKKSLAKSYNILVNHGGKREALKYWYIRSLDAVRQIILSNANQLVENNKLDSKEDIFWLNLKEAEKAFESEKKEIYSWIKQHKKYYTKLEGVNQFPKIIDSRGKILSFSQQEVNENELVGQPISPGKVIGKVKVLNTPDEKPLLPGEILVTRATDPGWTPLFINAGAILLEVGGLLQHGALVAREYGKPCIAGLENITEMLIDGQTIEVDASSGIIKII